MRANHLARLLLLIASMAALHGRAAAQDAAADEPTANPGRPTVSTPATLTPVGYLQFETGFTAGGESPEFSTRYSLINVTKLTVAPRLEIFTSVEPIAHYTLSGATKDATADYFLGAQGVFLKGEAARPTLSASYTYRLYDGAAPEPDYGSPTNSLLFLASADVKGFHYDANAFFNEIIEKPAARAQYGQSLSVSHPLPHSLTVSGEIWRFTQPFLRNNAIGNLWAVSYAARRTLVFDVAYDHGLTGRSTHWLVLGGFTYLLPHRLWGSQAIR
jgi:hypothetical protein